MKPVLLLTACNPEIGSGHFWRMTTLLKLLKEKGVDSYIHSDTIPQTFPAKLQPCIAAELHKPNQYSLIIRDMRDSQITDIESLYRYTENIITVDDSGEGDTISNLSVKMLPLNTEKREKLEDFYFLYGFNFYSEILSLNSTPEKQYDICLYSGLSDSKKVKQLTESLSKHYSVLQYNHNSRLLYKNNTETEITIPYSEILLSSRISISHFGISLYEASLCGCSPVAINPTKYHSSLADNEPNIPITNLGSYHDIENIDLKSVFSKLLQNTHKSNAASDIKITMNNHIQNFYSLFSGFL